MPEVIKTDAPPKADRPPMGLRRSLLTRPAFIFAIALILRLATAAIFFRGEGRDMTVDSVYRLAEGYEAANIAQSLASGQGFSKPWPGAGPTAWLTPVMPTILAADMLVFGLHSRATLLVFVFFNDLCSALTIFPVFFVARRVAGRQAGDRIAALAAWLFVLNPSAGLAAYANIWYTTLSGLLAALLLWATLAVRDSRKPAAWIAYGLLWGAELLTHPTFLVLMPVALLWLVWPRLGFKSLDTKRVKLAAFACLAAVLCCVPWTARNFVVFHHFVPLRSDFGFELWRANHGGPPVHPNGDPGEQAEFSSLGEYAYTHEKQHEALVWIRAHPRVYMLETARRVTYFWFDLVGDNPLSRLVHKRTWFFKARFSYIFALLVAVVMGLITIRRQRRGYFWLFLSFPVIFPLVYYIALARDFHRFPIDPVLAVIAAFAVSAWLPAKALDAAGPSPPTAQDRETVPSVC